MQFLKEILIIILFISLFNFSLQAKSKKKKFYENLAIAFIFTELEKKVKERDKDLNYHSIVEKKSDCQHTEVVYRDMPWDKQGLYPAPFQDISVLCKSKNEKIIFVIGDSITGGPGLPKESTYPFYLTSRFESTVFVNAGINGSNTFHWRKGGILFDRIFTQNKDYIDGVILLIGGNNILFTEHVLKQRAIPELITSEIKHVINDIQTELPSVPIYLGNYPVPHVMSEDMYAALEDLRLNTAGTIAGPEFRTKFENRAEFFLKDYLHLNSKGQRQMGIIWEIFLKKEGWK